jgi:hypothetical protein
MIGPGFRQSEACRPGVAEQTRIWEVVDMSFLKVFGGFALASLIAGGSAMAGEGVLKIGRDQDSVFMDPILVSQNADVWVLNNINAQLVRNTRKATGI